MAPPADYFQRVDLTDTSGGGDGMLDRTGDNVREDFLNAIYNISPTQTPFMSGIGRFNADDTFTSWQQQDLAEPNDGNAAKDGDDIGADTSRKARRVGNVCQISRIPLIVTGRADSVTKAGRSSEMSYQLAMASKDLKKDMETILTGNVSAVPDLDGDTAPLLGGLRATFRDAVAPEAEVALVAGDGANGGVGADGIPDAATVGTARAMTQTLLDTCIEGIFTNGGEPDVIQVSPAMKRVVSTFLYSSSARIAAMYSDVGQKRSDGGAAAQASVDVYISDFGALKIIPNRFLGYTRAAGAPADSVYVLDMSLWATGYLRSFRTIKVASTGDATKKMLLVDYTLQYKQEMGSGVIGDIDKTAPMTA